jgi:hypothetical protein
MSNFCGRIIQFPHFGGLRSVVPPGVEVTPSPCASYYKSGRIEHATPECKECIQLLIANGDPDCPCKLGKNWCAFATCVHDEVKERQRCIRFHAAIFNDDDVQDGSFMPSLTLGRLGCSNK